MPTNWMMNWTNRITFDWLHWLVVRLHTACYQNRSIDVDDIDYDSSAYNMWSMVGNVCLNGMFYHYDSMMMMSNDLNVH